MLLVWSGILSEIAGMDWDIFFSAVLKRLRKCTPREQGCRDCNEEKAQRSKDQSEVFAQLCVSLPPMPILLLHAGIGRRGDWMCHT